MKIQAVNKVGDSRTGSLSGLSVEDIEKVLGFPANCEDDPDKVKYSWGFTVDGVRCGIWDYKGGYQFNSFSTFGPTEIFIKLFGEKNVGY